MTKPLTNAISIAPLFPQYFRNPDFGGAFVRTDYCPYNRVGCSVSQIGLAGTQQYTLNLLCRQQVMGHNVLTQHCNQLIMYWQKRMVLAHDVWRLELGPGCKMVSQQHPVLWMEVDVIRYILRVTWSVWQVDHRAPMSNEQGMVLLFLISPFSPSPHSTPALVKLE